MLALIAWAMLRYSRVLPITKFFAYSSILIAILAVVLAGKGIGALQEAGLVPVTALPGVPRITIIGLFPTSFWRTSKAVCVYVLSLLTSLRL